MAVLTVRSAEALWFAARVRGGMTFLHRFSRPGGGPGRTTQLDCPGPLSRDAGGGALALNRRTVAATAGFGRLAWSEDTA